MTARLALIALVVAGCYGDRGIPLTVTPDHAPLFGQVDVTVRGDLGSLGSVDYFAIAGQQVIDPRWSPDRDAVTVTLQGTPRPGRYDVVIRGSRGLTNQHGIFTYDPPPARVPYNWAAFGASFTQGTESNGIDPHTQRLGVAGQIAHTAGVFLGLPLLSPAVTPPLQPGDFSFDCTQLPGTGAGVNTITAVVSTPDGNFDLRYARLDWTMKNRNVAVGGATVAEVLRGVSGGKALLAHITNDPTVDPSGVLATEETSMIDRIEALDPDVGICTDLMGNDIDAAVVQADDLAPELITPVETLVPLLDEIMARLGALHGQYFIANLPSLTFVPHVAELRARRLAAGLDTAASFDAKVAAIDAATEAYNAALTQAVAPYPNLHVVDFKGYVDRVKGGITVGGERLTADAWGGLVSLDGLHLTDTGYALYAQTFIDRINEVLGTRIPAVDVEAVHAEDALAPGKLRAAGYTCVPPPS